MERWFPRASLYLSRIICYWLDKKEKEMKKANRKNIVALLLVIGLCQAWAFGQGYSFKTLPHPKNSDLNSDDGRSITNYGTVLMNYLPVGANFYRAIKVFPTGYVIVRTAPEAPFPSAMSLSNTGEVGGTAYPDGRGVGFLVRKNGAVRLYGS